MLKELTDVRLTILAGKLFQSFTTQTANAGLLTLQVALGLRTLDGWPGPLMEETACAEYAEERRRHLGRLSSVARSPLRHIKMGPERQYILFYP